MFKDYWKLNKLNVVLITSLIVAITVASILIVGFASADKTTNFSNSLVAYIPIITLYGNIALLGLLSLTLLITAIKTFVGTNRQFILMQRGRSYYLKFQLLTISLSSLLVGVITAGVMILFSLYIYTNISQIDYIPPFKVYSTDFSLLFPLVISCIFILVYYVIMYLIDIFSNTSLRYKRMAVRNLAVMSFILRTVLIGGLTFYVFIATENLRVAYESPYFKLIAQNSPYINCTIVLVVMVLVPVLIIDYMVFFKKKVLV